MAIPSSESDAHRALKRLALAWARDQGYRVAAAEVSLPRHKVRMDVAACRTVRGRTPRIEVTAILECKAFLADYRRDGRRVGPIRERLERLHARRERIEVELRRFYPTIHTGDSLFPEYETLDYRKPGHRLYEAILEEIELLARQLHANTKFERLSQHGAANLFYVVSEPGLVRPADLPPGWGLLEREGETLQLRTRPFWHEVPEDLRLAFLLRVAAAATREVHRAAGVGPPPDVRAARGRISVPGSDDARQGGAPARGADAGPPQAAGQSDADRIL